MRFPRQCPVFEVVSTGYVIVCKPGDIVEGCIDSYDDKDVLHFYSANHYGHSAEPWSTGFNKRMGRTLATLKPLNKAARDLVEALS